MGFGTELDGETVFIRKSSKDKAVALLNRIASETGGRAFYPQTLSELPQVANEIVRDLRTQYVVSYDPTNKAHDGTYRSIKVAIADAPGQGKRIALTRSGRTAGAGAGARPAPKSGATPVNNNARQPTNNPGRKSP